MTETNCRSKGKSRVRKEHVRIVEKNSWIEAKYEFDK